MIVVKVFFNWLFFQLRPCWGSWSSSPESCLNNEGQILSRLFKHSMTFLWTWNGTSTAGVSFPLSLTGSVVLTNNFYCKNFSLVDNVFTLLFFSPLGVKNFAVWFMQDPEKGIMHTVSILITEGLSDIFQNILEA